MQRKMLFYEREPFLSSVYLFLIRVFTLLTKQTSPPNHRPSAHTILCYFALFFIHTNHNHSMVLADLQSNTNLSTLNDASLSYHRSEQVVSMKPLLLSAPFVTSPYQALPAQPSTLMRKHIITDLVSDFKLQLKSIEDHELLVTTIQSTFDSLDQIGSSTEQNDTKTLIQLASKMEMKLSNALRIVNQTSQKIRNILLESNDQSNSLALESITLPCTVVKHTERSAISIDNLTNTKLPSDDFFSDDKIIDKRKTIEILNFLKNAVHLHETDDKNFTVNKRLMETLKRIDLTFTSASNLRDVFFLTNDNYASIGKCRNAFPIGHYKHLHASAVQTKNIILLIDKGESATDAETFKLIKAFALSILSVVSEDDRLNVFAVSSRVEIIDDSTTLQSATPDNKKKLETFINSLNGTEAITNHTLAFEHTFDWIRAVQETGTAYFSDKSTPLLVVYISRGSVLNASHALQTIAASQRQLKSPIIINTCAVVSDIGDSQIKAKQFLTNLAAQNYMKVIKADYDYNHKIMSKNRGKMFEISKNVSPNDMLAIASESTNNAWFESLQRPDVSFQKPVYDDFAKDEIITITTNCLKYGVFGVSLFLSDLAEDLIYYINRHSDGETSYAFLADKQGLTIWHPSFPSISAIGKEPIYPTDIKYFEKIDESIRQRLLVEHQGSLETIIESNKKMKTYHWRRVAEWYVVCLVRVTPNSESTMSAGNLDSELQQRHPTVLASTSNMNDRSVDSSDTTDAEFYDRIIFHRLDLAISSKLTKQIENSPSLCQYFKHISSVNQLILYLSPKSFKSPYQHLKTMCANDYTGEYVAHNDKCFHRIESIMAYIKDTTNLLTNPGLQPQVRSDVLQLSQFIEMLRIQHTSINSKIGKYVIRRYITSPNGIVLMHPGIALPNDFESSRRPWYRKAIENPDKLAITAPYLDVGGAGFIITISRVIYEGQSNVDIEKKKSRNVAAVVSIDVMAGFLYQVLLQSSDHCRSDENVKCFLIDDKGYLVVHPSILEAKFQSTLSNSPYTLNEHITHRESLTSNDILLHKNLVEKRLCQNLLNRKIQRYYKFNTSLNEVLTNVVNGERTKYQVMPISNTNMFAVILNSTDGNSGTAFCPCSTVDKVCFNCKRIELMNCECPCECSLDALSTGYVVNEYASDDLLEDEKNQKNTQVNAFESIEICPAPTEEFHPNKMNAENAGKLNTLSNCVNFTCDLYATQLDCLGIVGCEWCQVDIDGETLLQTPFCTHSSACFSGILGASTPYGYDGDIGASMIDSMLPSAYAAMGPVTVAIIVLFLIIASVMYCYRQNLDPGSEQLYCEQSLPMEHNFGLPLSRLDCENSGSDVIDKASNANNISSDISPYRMHAGNFRRPNGQNESDNGYSTMTPHEDSDHACFTLIEPLISNTVTSEYAPHSGDNDTMLSSSSMNYGKHGTKTDAMAISPDKTYFTNSHTTSHHYIEAPVTVHQPMEAIL